MASSAHVYVRSPVFDLAAGLASVLAGPVALDSTDIMGPAFRGVVHTSLDDLLHKWPAGPETTLAGRAALQVIRSL